MSLVALATIPTGVWFGLDAILPNFFRRRRAKAA